MVDHIPGLYWSLWMSSLHCRRLMGLHYFIQQIFATNILSMVAMVIFGALWLVIQMVCEKNFWILFIYIYYSYLKIIFSQLQLAINVDLSLLLLGVGFYQKSRKFSQSLNMGPFSWIEIRGERKLLGLSNCTFVFTFAFIYLILGLWFPLWRWRHVVYT